MQLDKIKKAATKKLTELMANEKAMKLMADPRFQNAVMGALKLQAQVRGQLQKSAGAVAKQLDIATRKEVKTLKRKVKDLEKQIKKLTASE